VITDARTGASGRAALIVGHPGHELRVYRWLELVQPTVYVLTDGSGHTGLSRLDSTSKVLSAAGATPGTLFGSFSDADLYAAMLAGDRACLCRVVHTLADALSRTNVDYVVADALEGFNPSHDLCRFLVNAAVALARQTTHRPLRNFDFLLEGSPNVCPDHLRAAAVTLELSDEELERKIAAAKGYAELRAETDWALARFGAAAFRTECLRPVIDTRQGIDEMEQEPPYYERYGEQQVAAGHYDRVIRYRAHVQPLVRSLWHDVGLNGDYTTVTIASATTGRSI
jgi:AcrR family transcriptional regulator